MGAMKRLLEEIKEEMGDAYDLMLAEEYQASLIAASTSEEETSLDVQNLEDDPETHLAPTLSDE